MAATNHICPATFYEPNASQSIGGVLLYPTVVPTATRTRTPTRTPTAEFTLTETLIPSITPTPTGTPVLIAPAVIDYQYDPLYRLKSATYSNAFQK